MRMIVIKSKGMYVSGSHLDLWQNILGNKQHLVPAEAVKDRASLVECGGRGNPGLEMPHSPWHTHTHTHKQTEIYSTHSAAVHSLTQNPEPELQIKSGKNKPTFFIFFLASNVSWAFTASLTPGDSYQIASGNKKEIYTFGWHLVMY